MASADADRDAAGAQVKPAEKADPQRGRHLHVPLRRRPAPGPRSPQEPGAAATRSSVPPGPGDAFTPRTGNPSSVLFGPCSPHGHRRGPDRRRARDASVSAMTTARLSASRQGSTERFRDNRAATLATIVPTAVIAFDFDPLLRLGDGAVRWETVGIAAAIFVALVAFGATARSVGRRPDDLLFVVLGIVPGAVVGGRIGYVLLHPDFFGADPGRIVDPGVGSLELTLGVVGGAVTGSLVGALLDGRPGRWLHAAAAPLLLVVSIGKLAMVLGGSGQGQPTSGQLATAYVGPGPWGSLGPDLPSIPSQALEGIASFALLLGLLVALASARRTSVLRGPGGVGRRPPRRRVDLARSGGRRTLAGRAGDRRRRYRRRAPPRPRRRDPLSRCPRPRRRPSRRGRSRVRLTVEPVSGRRPSARCRRPDRASGWPRGRRQGAVRRSRRHG